MCKSYFLDVTFLFIFYMAPWEEGQGCFLRPFKKPAERTCPICKIKVEDEYHFLNICPAYLEKRCSLLDYVEKEY